VAKWPQAADFDARLLGVPFWPLMLLYISTNGQKAAATEEFRMNGFEAVIDVRQAFSCSDQAFPLSS
jgi:hypothetical protein